jgi:hypothetical protein
VCVCVCMCVRVCVWCYLSLVNTLWFVSWPRKPQMFYFSKNYLLCGVPLMYIRSSSGHLVFFPYTLHHQLQWKLLIRRSPWYTENHVALAVFLVRRSGMKAVNFYQKISGNLHLVQFLALTDSQYILIILRNRLWGRKSLILEFLTRQPSWNIASCDVSIYG